MIKLNGWGNYPSSESSVYKLDGSSELAEHIVENSKLIAFGNGRSYGDSALSERTINTLPYNYFKHFDPEKGLLHVQAGILLEDILRVFVPQGWFLAISPGTKLITIGGAIAADVHGKNHHLEGCFSECVQQFEIMLASGQIVDCSRSSYPELFRATCGGQGLTGVILTAKIVLKKIQSKYIQKKTIKTNNLADTFRVFSENRSATYSVAWLDCLASGDRLGRAHVTLGEFCTDGRLDYSPRVRFNLPFFLPRIALNSWCVKILNRFYYHRLRDTISTRVVDLDSFFYPLDSIGHWNKAYGKQGFVQYQFILPLENSFDGLTEVLRLISQSNKGSFLAVLKLYGKENENYLSFPMQGYSLALDFKIEDGVFELLERLDEIVVKFAGRIYLAKDARVSSTVFEQGYPDIEKFRAFRKQQNMVEKFSSLQSRRLSI